MNELTRKYKIIVDQELRHYQLDEDSSIANGLDEEIGEAMGRIEDLSERTNCS